MFAMRLALAAGRLDVDEVLAGLTARQLAEWRAFDRIEGGIGSRGAWLRAAHLLALVAETRRNKGKRSQPFTAREFLPWVEQAQITPAAFRARFRNVKVKKKKG